MISSRAIKREILEDWMDEALTHKQEQTQSILRRLSPSPPPESPIDTSVSIHEPSPTNISTSAFSAASSRSASVVRPIPVKSASNTNPLQVSPIATASASEMCYHVDPRLLAWGRPNQAIKLTWIPPSSQPSANTATIITGQKTVPQHVSLFCNTLCSALL
jgi:hypothetical protein